MLIAAFSFLGLLVLGVIPGCFLREAEEPKCPAEKQYFCQVRPSWIGKKGEAAASITI